MPGIWGPVYQRAKEAGKLEGLKVYVPPPNRELRGTSSYINYFLARDSRPEPPAASAPGVPSLKSC